MSTNIPAPYTANIGEDSRHYVAGPGNGCSFYSGTLFPEMRLSSKEDAEAAAKIANEAYMQGYQAAQQAIRSVLGIGSGR